MSNQEKIINQFLNSMGFSGQLEPVPDLEFSLKAVDVAYAGVDLIIALEEDTFVFVQHIFCFVPKMNITPFFRRLLALQTQMGGVYFFIDETQNIVGLRVGRRVEGLELIEFKAMLDDLSSRYWQIVSNLIEEFQLPQEPY